ncbi:LON peptidase N-terminal domain and RING finger protein 3 isoform X2 [Arabidopsis lyrata subsp. lyrata]|uniref:LON peptidase N-terminal domain and RING finger protein 3 isoform X2 n=1 Tax=Arabidopsis lyrata subsp. lyrata TaxID=81972 RepID=UPI000A29A747|nr:LON peptidase N-terminal domain and RING finger protein 3 isoform X2 [Arabidopsis lyrata subsp. lyrata]|eukprot:XP_020876105.1 LON peptidase N-terminal domain and RING finger protein 3 isoform X2 [Arabidopsis lyrata subsp. lyrata]
MIQMDGGDRLRVTLFDRMSTVENGRSSVTLEDILMAETSSFRSLTAPPSPARNHSNSSLLDVMRRERRRDKTAWKSLRDKLRLKRAATGWISSNPIPNLDNPILTPDSDSHRFNRLGFLLSNSETNRSNGDVSDGGEEAAEREGRLRLGTVLAADREPPRMSLMELLEDNDGQMYEVNAREEAEAEERDCCGRGGEAVAVTGAAELGCCVCMIRSKGAAFIPCGHTFCRLCSRELWVQRGNCPLCNTAILQVLDIF